MKWSIPMFLICLLTTTQVFGQTATFVASTPCSTGKRPLPGIPQGKKGCDLIKWHLRLNGAGNKQTPGTYILECDYGIPKQGTRDFINGGNHLHREGKWEMVKGTSENSSVVIYKLDPDKPAESISFMWLNDNMLHLLDDDGHLMIGNGAWSYTLSKVKQ